MRIIQTAITGIFLAFSLHAQAVGPCGPVTEGAVCVTAIEYGQDWPYTFPHGVMSCTPDTISARSRAYVGIAYRGSVYAVNGAARNNPSFRSADPVTKPHPVYTGGWMFPPRALMDRGLSLCP